MEPYSVESIGVESIGVVGVVGVRTPEKSAHNTVAFNRYYFTSTRIEINILCPS